MTTIHDSTTCTEANGQPCGMCRWANIALEREHVQLQAQWLELAQQIEVLKAEMRITARRIAEIEMRQTQGD